MAPFSLRSLLLAAIVLSNYLVWTATRHHHTHNLSRHRSRHRRQGAGLYLPASYVLPGGEGSGAWGEWGEVSPCSRTCGGGVASQKRICLEVSPEGQPLCTGGDTKYFSCQTQDCPETVDFRAEQCAEYDDIAFRGIKYKWLPYTNAPNPCELNCMPRGERFYFRQKTKVVDGTRCNDESFDVCVNGTCQPVGCDMMLGSNAHEDKCRECRGNGTNCRTISGLIDSSDLRKGYNDVLLIPQGSTSIYISEVRASNNYLALRSKQDNVYYLNGEYHIDFPRSLTIAGATWHYERSQQGFAAPDKLRCLGPTTEPLYLSLLLQDENVGIEYEYSLPTALAPPPNQQYNWVYGEFTPCSATCGGGTQSRQVTCRSREELEVVEDSLCDTGLKPVTDQTCNTDPCPPRWVDEPWGPCSKPCGEGGTRSRQVYCQKIIVNGLQSIVADKECFDLLGPKPELYQECNRNATCPTWFAGPWKPCDKLCDEGKQTRQVVCHQKINGKVEVFEDAMCEEEKPATEQSCMLRPCEGVDWVLSDWSGCDTCTSSVRTRVAHCATSMHKVVNSSFCSYHPAPVLEEPCDRTKLPSCQLLWYATQWSKCSVECGKGIQSRRVFCGLFDGASVIKVDDDRCDSKLRYNDTKPCEVPSEKCDAKWYAGPWSNCTKDCGGGQQYRRVMCLSGGVEVKTCPEDTILEAMQACNTEPCTNDPKTSPAKAATATDDYYDYEECIEEDYPEAGAEAIGPSGVTIEDVMFSDGPVTDYEGSGDYETQFTLETGSGSESTDVWTTDETGSGSTGTDFTDETTVFTSITDTTESTTDESESELTGEFIPISSKKPLYSASKKSEVTDTISSTEPSSTISDSSVSGSTETGITEVSTDGSTDSSSTLDISESSGDESTVTSYSSTESSTIENTELTGSSEGASSSVSETELTDLTESTIAERTESTETSASSASTEATETGTTEGGSTKGASESSSLSSETEITDTTELFTTEATKSDTDSSETDSSVTTELVTKATKEESVSSETSTSDSMTTDLVTTGSTESEPTEITESTVTDTTLTESSETTESESSEITESESSASTESVSSVSTESASNVSTESELSATTESGSSATTDSESSATTESGSSATTESGSSATTESESSATTESEPSATTESNATTDLETSASTEYETSSTTESGSSVSTEAESLATTETTDRETTIAGASTGSTEEATVSESSATTESTTEESTESSETTESSIASTETESAESSTTEVSASSLSTTEVSESEEEETSEETGSTTESASTTETIEETSTTSGSTLESSETSASSSIENASTTEISSTEESSGTTETRLEGLSTTEISTERETGTEIGTTPWDWKTTVEVYTKKPGCKARRKVAKCIKSKYGCCPDKRTPAKGPFEEGCESPKTCKETKHGCCPDGVSPATGPRGQGCPLPACSETLFGCCLSDNVTAAEDNDQQGCPPAKPACAESKYGCCPDDKTESKGPRNEGCPEEEVTNEETGCFASEFGCCADNSTAATGPDGKGCPCNITAFGCCPDGVSPAQGTQMEGCVFSCNSTEFGCCADGETPAHGPEQEGCCLQFPFGCCPDNYKPAAGPHLEGCMCADAHYGCCPDNKTIARGPKNEGCGCQYTEFGCCPDRHTTATGPDFEGCSCNTYQFGCCPDGVTISTGPNLEGCRCQYSQYGCCGDELTAAVGPDQLGCDCASSKYGCCPDGQTEAKGEKFLGCSNVPVNRQEACSLPTERGSCRNYTVQWYYDMEYGGCSRFWYGGCEGNGNRFQSKEECEDVCVQPSPKDACNLPKVKGACVGYNLRWYYDKEQQVCGQFVFGGCLGNANNFESRELCQAQCQPQKNVDECELPMEEGPCAGSFARWFFDQKTRRCFQFVWGGCAGNGNRFTSEAACMQRCSPPGKPQPSCVEPLETGNCTEKHAAWSFSQTENRCVPFYYTGCGGNGNRFDTEASCVASCPSVYEPEICVLPAETGECADYREKWFYDTTNKGCRQFYYGGCGGNENRFDSQQECEMRCSEIPTTTTTEPTTVQTTRPTTITRPAETTRPEETTRPVPQVQPPESGSQRSDFCALELDPGPCEELQSRWGYDGSLGTCITFMYGGCGGNRNNFPSQEYCNYFCPDETVASRFDPETSSDDICRLPMRAGPCDQSLMRWFYDPSTDSCSQFTYGGCEGNANRFESLEECESRCKTRPEPMTSTTTTTSTTTPATTTNAVTVEELPRECIVSPILEECSGAGTVWYADSSRQCVQHVNADTGVTCRLTGVFSSPEACERSCGAFRNIDVCRYPLDAGPCRSFEPKFYFDGDSSSCRQFLYGGCHGGPNRFSTFDECEDICQPKSDPCKVPPEPGNCLAYLPLWYYDEARDDCSQFIYSGCNGNGNRFDTREDCEGRCKKRPSTTLAPTTEVITTTTTTTTTTTAAPTTTQQILVEEQCRRPASLEPCGASAAVFYYDETRGTCLPAEFGNCRHPNSYRSEEECERRCGVFRALDVCRYRLDPGPCNETGIMKVYWDAESGRCQPFAYGGCQGGPNRFSSVDECEEVCGPSGPETNEVLPDCEAYNAECAALRCAYGVQRTRTAGGCERCACVQVEVDCAPLLQECQRLKCYYGMLNETGDDGCQRCRCLDHPCANKKCAEGERCVPTVFRDPVLQEISYVASCNVMNKTGSCPVAEEMPVLDGSCRVECNDDADCRGEAKCCARGCSQLCLAPAAPTPSPAANIAATSAAPLTTAYQPELPQAPRANTATEPEVSAAEGGKATLRCLFHGNPPPKITWSRGAITIDGTSDRYRLLSDGALEIVSLYRNDSGVYICIADNGLGVARQEIRLLVNDPVEAPVGIAGDSDTVVMGELNRVLYIRCMAYGYPMPFIQWFRGMSGPMVPYSSSLYEARGSVLQIRRLDYDTLGDYACQAYNGVGKPASWSVVVKAYRPEGDETDNPYLVDRQERVRITPREPITEATTTPVPEITVPVYTVPVTTRILSSTATVATGAQLTLPCEVDGYPEPEVRWTKDGVPLLPSDRIDITESRLTITSTNINDSGLYGCHARNAFSSHSSTVQITVEGLYIPPTCKDNPFFANCNLIVRSKFCTHKYYSNFCCKSCVEAGLLNPLDLDILVK